MKIKDPDVEKPPSDRARPSRTTHPVASVSQSISSPDRFSTIHDFVRRMGIDVELSETKEELRGYLEAKLENARRE